MTDPGQNLFATPNPALPTPPLFEGTSTRPHRHLGALLRTRREEVGLSQFDLGRLAGVHRGTVRNVELGKPMETGTLNSLARIVGCVPAGQSLRTVLSATTTNTITTAILRQPRNDAWAPTTRWYLDVVTSCSVGGQVALSGVGEDLLAQIPPRQADDVRRELGVAGTTVPAQSVPLAELHVVLNSDLPADTQTELVTHLQGRRAEMEAALEREARLLVDQIRTHRTSDTTP